jgi:hypothetical protein
MKALDENIHFINVKHKLYLNKRNGFIDKDNPKITYFVWELWHLCQ